MDRPARRIQTIELQRYRASPVSGETSRRGPTVGSATDRQVALQCGLLQASSAITPSPQNAPYKNGATWLMRMKTAPTIKPRKTAQYRLGRHWRRRTSGEVDALANKMIPGL